jgi:hypothetical protein
VTYSRGLPGFEGAGVSLRATPTPSFATVLAGCSWPTLAGGGFSSPCRAAKSLMSWTTRGGADVGVRVGAAAAGRAGSVVVEFLLCASWVPWKRRLLIRTFRAMTEWVLLRRLCVADEAGAEKRRREESVSDWDCGCERGCCSCVPGAAGTIGVAMRS